LRLRRRLTDFTLTEESIMPSPNPFQTAAHCWRFACRRALAEGDTFHIVTTGNPAAPRGVLSDRELFAREDMMPEDIEASCDPFLFKIGNAGER
jgi:hypothetical protein